MHPLSMRSLIHKISSLTYKTTKTSRRSRSQRMMLILLNKNYVSILGIYPQSGSINGVLGSKSVNQTQNPWVVQIPIELRTGGTRDCLVLISGEVIRGSNPSCPRIRNWEELFFTILSILCIGCLIELLHQVIYCEMEGCRGQFFV